MKKQKIHENIAVFFPKDSEAMFNRNSNRTFGGSTIHLYQFIKEMYDYIKVYTIIPNYATIDFNDNDRFLLIKLYNEADGELAKFLKFRKFVKLYRIKTVIQLGLTIQSCILAFYCYLVGMKFVFMFAHDVESFGLYQNSRKKCRLFFILIKYSSLLITQNSFEKLNILKRYPLLSNIHVIKKGIDFERIHKSSRKHYSGISIARCEEWKNIESYLEIVGLNINHKFLLICPPVPGKEEYFTTIKNHASQFKNLTFYPFISYDKIYELLSLSKVIFLTSDMEGDWPLTVIEAAASGLPVLSLNCNYGLLVEDYKAGFFCSGSIDEMNESFLKLMTDKRLFITMSKNAKKYAYENHNSKLNVQQILELISN